MGDSTRSAVDSVVRLNRLQELYKEDGFVKSVQEAMKGVSDNQGKDVRISFGPNVMHDDFANYDIQWPFACFVIDFARKRKVKQVKTAFENCLKAYIKGDGDESGLMVCCDHAQKGSCYDKYTFYVLDRILLKESLERIVESYAQGGECPDLVNAIRHCHQKTPKSLKLNTRTRNNVIVQIVSFTRWQGSLHGIEERSIEWPNGIHEALKNVLRQASEPDTLKDEALKALRKSQEKLLDYTPPQPRASRSVENTQNVANAAISPVIETGNDSGPKGAKRRRDADSDHSTSKSDPSPTQHGLNQNQLGCRPHDESVKGNCDDYRYLFGEMLRNFAHSINVLASQITNPGKSRENGSANWKRQLEILKASKVIRAYPKWVTSEERTPLATHTLDRDAETDEATVSLCVETPSPECHKRLQSQCHEQESAINTQEEDQHQRKRLRPLMDTVDGICPNNVADLLHFQITAHECSGPRAKKPSSATRME